MPAAFDDPNPVSSPALVPVVPVVALAEVAGLRRLAQVQLSRVVQEPSSRFSRYDSMDRRLCLAST